MLAPSSILKSFQTCFKYGYCFSLISYTVHCRTWIFTTIKHCILFTLMGVNCWRKKLTVQCWRHLTELIFFYRLTTLSIETVQIHFSNRQRNIFKDIWDVYLKQLHRSRNTSKISWTVNFCATTVSQKLEFRVELIWLNVKRVTKY